MDNEIQKWVISLERAWDENGFLWKVRGGHFDIQEGEEFINFLRLIENENYQVFDKRFVSLIWYIPLFLDWQKERVIEKGADALSYGRFNSRVSNAVQNILGVP